MADIKNNSDKARATEKNQEPRTKPVVSKDDVVEESKARSNFREFCELFLPQDPDSLRRSVMERIADGFKSLASDLFNSFLYPGSWNRSTNSSSSSVTGPYWKGTTVVQQGTTIVPNSELHGTPRSNVVEIRLRTYNAALDVWKECAETLSQYPFLRVMDLKVAAQVKTLTTDSDYGWKSMEKFQLVKNFDGSWSIVAPQPYELQ